MPYQIIGRLGTCALKHSVRRNLFLVGSVPSRELASNPSPLVDILQRVQDGTLTPAEALKLIGVTPHMKNDQALESFANLDHERFNRTGFPEAVFAEGKIPAQVAAILDDMARRANESALHSNLKSNQLVRSAILATRVNSEMYSELSKYNFQNGKIAYHPAARIVLMEASSKENVEPGKQQFVRQRVVVATAGTTDIPVAEEAAVTLEAIGIPVDRVYDVGVAGLHRIIRALPKLTHPSVGCCIVAAGMDGALPSVVGGLVTVPVIAVPTSIGYGASFGGVSALLTMMNSCSPGIGIVNIDNGFGAAALAFKCISRGAAQEVQCLHSSLV